MQVNIESIQVNSGRREALPDAVRELADSISAVGLLNPITVDRDYILIAGLHRLEAAKLLGWAEIECNVSSLEGLQAELAEIDENFVRADLETLEFGKLLLRRKEIYTLGDKHYDTLEESIADLKNPDKDCSYTPDTLLADIDGFVQTFHKGFAWYHDPFCTIVFPHISKVQFEFVRQRFESISSAMADLLNQMERTINV